MMSKLEKYPKYKDSGVEWLGEIPEEWEALSNKHIFRLKKNLVGKKSNQYDLLSLTLKGIIKRDMENPEGKFPAEFDTYQEVKKGDFVFCLFDVEETPRTIGLSKYDGMITGAYTVMTNTMMDNSFLYYFYLNMDTSKRMKFLYKGLRNTIPKDSFFAFKTFVPPKKEQTKIANYLDKKTAQIDKAISLKEQMIERLKERRQILINDAVTKGLDKTVKMKDSGIEWIGEIPEHWEASKLFSLCNSIRGNSSFSKDELLSSGKYVALQYGKTYKVDEIDEKYKCYVNDEFYKNSQIVNFGDTIFISTSETIEDLGHSVYYKRSDLGLLGGEQILLKPKREIINSKYLYFSSKVFSKKLRKYATGIKVFRFNINDLKTIYIPLPPTEEQKQIVEYIEIQIAKIDKAIELQQNHIDKLKEYKATLIDSVVTGKVRVS